MTSITPDMVATTTAMVVFYAESTVPIRHDQMVQVVREIGRAGLRVGIQDLEEGVLMLGVEDLAGRRASVLADGTRIICLSDPDAGSDFKAVLSGLTKTVAALLVYERN